SLTLSPGEGASGRCTTCEGGSSFSLSAPILDFTATEVLDDTFHLQARQVLESWIRIDQNNLYRVRTGIRQFCMPVSYITNQAPGDVGIVTQGLGTVDAAQLQAAIQSFIEQLQWISDQLHRSGDLAGRFGGRSFSVTLVLARKCHI